VVRIITEENKIIIRGPLGIWVFPLLNVLLQLIRLAKFNRPAYQNIETITWTDWRGKERRIEIHRNAEWG
jgi:hypothetical protein